MLEAYKTQGEAMWEKFNAPEDKKIWFYEQAFQIISSRLDSPIVKELEILLRQARKRLL
jgi:hypothetical protein